MLTRRATLAGVAALPAVSALAQQPTFPAKPLTMIVPFPPGGPADIFGRYLAKGMSENLGKPVVVENKSGVAGVAGMDFVAKAVGDAHVMGLTSASAGAIMPTLMTNMPYNALRDLAAVILVVRVQEVLVVDAKLGISDLKTLIERLKAEPGKFSYGSAGTGGITHLAMELFKRETGTDAVHVPYRGAAPATNDLVAGLVQLTILDVPVVLPHIKSGALKAIAVTSDVRAPLLPDVPTMRELGYGRVNSDNWYGLQSPHGATRANRDRLHDAAAEALKAKDLIEAYTAVGGIVGGGTSEDFANLQRREIEKWAEVIRRANIRLE
ncbi:Tripartite-type tricarboxylate transporter, receptor component TctC [Enhydrobacter aerosaccus]|uniref:Tripartite-type tricarboxylate transporter, receptor component TctC n=1 Tax=Enhydrobacter aerosaccus TaxID=225324 RepID=A0A1T4T243_9HYPH|nr:tripartite tricarboxylate transporter substrate-binding protein [Enhydrobacter aerosaccus]SKA34311.1 Tripartite-type tricarboxylate transporter, receptor component TctC [Enhydrobacter aerosaccus]